MLGNIPCILWSTPTRVRSRPVCVGVCVVDPFVSRSRDIPYKSADLSAD